MLVKHLYVLSSFQFPSEDGKLISVDYGYIPVLNEVIIGKLERMFRYDHGK